MYNTIETKSLAHFNIRRIGIDVAPEVGAPIAEVADGSDKIVSDKSDKMKAVAPRPAPSASATPAANNRRPNA